MKKAVRHVSRKKNKAGKRAVIIISAFALIVVMAFAMAMSLREKPSDSVKYEYTGGNNILEEAQAKLLTLGGIKAEPPFGLDSLLKGNYLEKISEIARSKLGVDRVLSRYKDTEKFLNATRPDAENFESFVLTLNGIDFIFPAGRLAPANEGEFRLKVLYSELEGMLKLNLSQSGFVPDNPIPLPNRVVDTSKPMIALTFDDGPRAGSTELIIEALTKYNAAATFFVVGNRLENHADLLKMIVSSGNEVGSHSYSHPSFGSLSLIELQNEANKTQETVYKLTGYTVRHFRTPGGARNDLIKTALKDYPLIMWSVDTNDWRYKDTDQLINYMKNYEFENGDIVLMHDLHTSTGNAMDEVIRDLVERGYELVTLSELFYYQGIEAKGGEVYFTVN